MKLMPCKILLTTFLKKKRKKNRYNPMKFLFLLLFIHISKIFIKNLLIESFKGMVIVIIVADIYIKQ